MSKEVQTMDMVGSAMSRSEYDKVIFHEIADCYCTDADVECCYTLTASIVPRKGDWIALFKIGWDDCEQYYACKVVPVPGEEQSGQLSILFKAETMPSDDGNYYQFCYLTADNLVKGASIPFRFRRPSDDDLLEVEDSDNDLLVIRTRTAVIEERLRDVAVKNNQLLKDKTNLELEIVAKERETFNLENKVNAREKELVELHREMVKTSADVERERKEFMDQLNELRETSSIQLTAAKMLQAQNEAYINELRGTIKVLTDQKEDLNKQLAVGMKETHFFNSKLNDAESRMKVLSLKNEQLAKELCSECETTVKLQQQVKTLEVNIREDERKIADIKAKLASAELEIKRLMTQLVDTEHMLAAMEKSKQLATEELMTHNEFKVKNMAELDQARGDYNHLLGKYKLTEIEHDRLVYLNDELKTEISNLKEKNEELKELNEREVHDAKRYIEQECNLQTVIEDLTYRLKLGANEYQKKYLECLKLEKKFSKLKQKYKEMRQVSSNGKNDESTSESNIPEPDQEQAEAGHSNDNLINKRLDVKFARLAHFTDQKSEIKKTNNVPVAKTEHNEEDFFKTVIEEKNYRIMSLEDTLRKLSTPNMLATSGRNKQQPTVGATMSEAYSNPPYYPYPNYVLTPPPVNPFHFEDQPLFRERERNSAESGNVESHNVNILEHDGGKLKFEENKILPPPMKPEITPNARVAAITALARLRNTESVFADGWNDSSRIERGPAAERENAKVEAVKPESAETGKIACPLCSYAPCNIHDLEEHMEGHFNLECPMCKRLFDPKEQQTYVQHVHEHFPNDYSLAYREENLD